MMQPTRLAAGVLLAAHAASAQGTQIFITNASVVDVETGQVRAGQTIRIEGNRIREIGPAGRLHALAGKGYRHAWSSRATFSTAHRQSGREACASAA